MDGLAYRGFASHETTTAIKATDAGRTETEADDRGADGGYAAMAKSYGAR